METGARVIVVDDEPVVRQLLQIALSDMGHHVEVYATCEAGIERAKRRDFDVAFVDKNLPDGSGITICRELADADCKVALITGYANLTSAVEAMRHGVADYFTKPLDLDDLAARLGRMLFQLRLERANRALVSELQNKCDELERVAARDAVTGVFNHTHLQGQLDVEVERSRGHQRFCLALISIDRFAAVNDQLGHQGGDDVLRQVAQLLGPEAGILGRQDVVCRVGGDTFATILPNTPRNGGAAKLQGFRERLAALRFSTQLPVLTTSIAIGQYPEDGVDRKALYRATERTLVRAKSLGGDSLLTFDVAEGDGPQSNRAVNALRGLGACLANRAVRFSYQPIVSASAGRPIAYEALCRPTSPEYRHVGDLLDAAGRAGRIWELGRVLRDVAIEPMAALPADCLLFLNVHPQELDGPFLFDDTAAFYKFADRIVLEITETEQLANFAEARAKLRHLRSAGFRIALDDFGAGYQGFSSLALLEPDYVKLDMGIVRGITAHCRAARLTRHIREFCAGEGILTIAEGVETELEYTTLLDLGLDLIQGYLLGRPCDPFCAIHLPEARRLAV